MRATSTAVCSIRYAIQRANISAATASTSAILDDREGVRARDIGLRNSMRTLSLNVRRARTRLALYISHNGLLARPLHRRGFLLPAPYEGRSMSLSSESM